MKPWLAIVNPAAGLPEDTRRIVARLQAAAGAIVEIATTTEPGDATRLAAAARDFDGLVAVGGDGTIAEILNGMDGNRQTLALVPAGHGNCLARDLGLRSVDGALAALLRGPTLRVDVIRARIGFEDGHVDERRCASTLAFGYVADVVHCGRGTFARLGRYAYTVAAVTTRPVSRRLRVDGEGRERAVTNLVVNNTAHLANFRAFHRARLDDGQLDVLESDFGWGRQQLHNIAVLSGRERLGPRTMWQAPAVSVQCRAPSRLMVDGEVVEGVVRLDAGCQPGALRCRAPAR